MRARETLGTEIPSLSENTYDANFKLIVRYSEKTKNYVAFWKYNSGANVRWKGKEFLGTNFY